MYCSIGEDEQDKGMEMENDFEGEMFDVPKGDDKEQEDKVSSWSIPTCFYEHCSTQYFQ